MGEELTLQEALMTLRGKLETLSFVLEANLVALNSRWRAGDRELNALETLYRKYSYLAPLEAAVGGAGAGVVDGGVEKSPPQACHPEVAPTALRKVKGIYLCAVRMAVSKDQLPVIFTA